jgi:hypothetical protein
MATNEQHPVSGRRRRAGWIVVAGAALAGLLLARLIDWRSHAHPR